jgi:hypothetical protein
MKSVLFVIAAVAFCGTAHADDNEIYLPQCLAQAKAAVAKEAKASLGNIELNSAALIGDGVDAVEAISLKIKGTHNGLYFINMEYDDCSVFLGPKFLSN